MNKGEKNVWLITEQLYSYQSISDNYYFNFGQNVINKLITFTKV